MSASGGHAGACIGACLCTVLAETRDQSRWRSVVYKQGTCAGPRSMERRCNRSRHSSQSTLLTLPTFASAFPSASFRIIRGARADTKGQHSLVITTRCCTSHVPRLGLRLTTRDGRMYKNEYYVVRYNLRSS